MTTTRRSSSSPSSSAASSSSSNICAVIALYRSGRFSVTRVTPGASCSTRRVWEGWRRFSIVGSIAQMSPASREARPAFLDERGDALSGLTVFEQRLLLLRFELDAGLQRQVEGRVDRPDPRALRGERSAGELAGQRERLPRHVAFGEPVHESDGQRLVGGYLPRGQHDVQRPAPPDQAGQSLGTAGTGDQPELDLWQPVPGPG